MSLNPQTVKTAENILSLNAKPVDIAKSVKGATQGEIIDASLAATNAVQSFGAIMSKTFGKMAPPFARYFRLIIIEGKVRL